MFLNKHLCKGLGNYIKRKTYEQYDVNISMLLTDGIFMKFMFGYKITNIYNK